MRVYIHEKKGIPENHWIIVLNPWDQGELLFQEILDSLVSKVPHTILTAISPFEHAPELTDWPHFLGSKHIVLRIWKNLVGTKVEDPCVSNGCQSLEAPTELSFGELSSDTMAQVLMLAANIRSCTY